MEFFTVRKDNPQDMQNRMEMALALRPDHTHEEITQAMHDILSSDREEAYLVKENDEYIAFADISVRNDYVEGSSWSPVGYLEGIYVKPAYRGRWIAKKLLDIAEKWAAERWCTEMWSDTWLRNTESQEFHKKIGFEEADKIVHFIKKIERS